MKLLTWFSSPQLLLFQKGILSSLVWYHENFLSLSEIIFPPISTLAPIQVPGLAPTMLFPRNSLLHSLPFLWRLIHTIPCLSFICSYTHILEDGIRGKYTMLLISPQECQIPELNQIRNKRRIFSPWYKKTNIEIKKQKYEAKWQSGPQMLEVELLPTPKKGMLKSRTESD